MTRAAYAAYAAAAARIAIGRRPDIVYASDPLGAGPGLLAARLAGARLVYHEHDTPNPGTLHPWLARLRRAAARRAAAVIFPNEARARIARAELGFSGRPAAYRLEHAAPLPSCRCASKRRTSRCSSTITATSRLFYCLRPSSKRFGNSAAACACLIAGYEAPGARRLY